MDYDKLKTFCVLMENKTLVETAKITKLSISGVQRQIAALESALQTKLFIKQNRLLKPTPEGDRFYEHALKILEAYELALADTQEKSDELYGEFTINATSSSVASWVLEDMAGFIQNHNKVTHVVQADDRPVRLIKNECDVFLRPKEPDAPDLDQRLIKSFVFKLYASQKYVDKHGAPQTLEDLNGHNILMYGTPQSLQNNELNWHLPFIEDLHHHVTYINSGLGILRAIENHLGIGIISSYSRAISRTPLVDLFPEKTSHTIDLYMISLKNTQKKAHIDKLYEHFRRGMKGA